MHRDVRAARLPRRDGRGGEVRVQKQKNLATPKSARLLLCYKTSVPATLQTSGNVTHRKVIPMDERYSLAPLPEGQTAAPGPGTPQLKKSRQPSCGRPVRNMSACLVCSTPFPCKPSHVDKKRYCSIQCSRTGIRLAASDQAAAALRFWAKVNKSGPDGIHSQTGVNLGPCWVWTGAKIKAYGQFGTRGKGILTHRWAYEDRFGEVPKTLELDHLCRVRACCNPSHLEAVTSAVNTRRGVGSAVTKAYHAATTHCPKGHEYTADNTHLQIRSDGVSKSRHCRACWAASRLARANLRREAREKHDLAKAP